MANDQLNSVANDQPASFGDDPPVTGGIDLPPHLIATPAFADECAPDDHLGRLLYWLLKLHPDAISHKFELSDLTAMDDETKRQFIAEIQIALGIAPLRGDFL